MEFNCGKSTEWPAWLITGLVSENERRYLYHKIKNDGIFFLSSYCYLTIRNNSLDRFETIDLIMEKVMQDCVIPSSMLKLMFILSSRCIFLNRREA